MMMACSGCWWGSQRSLDASIACFLSRGNDIRGQLGRAGLVPPRLGLSDVALAVCNFRNSITAPSTAALSLFLVCLSCMCGLDPAESVYKLVEQVNLNTNIFDRGGGCTCKLRLRPRLCLSVCCVDAPCEFIQF